MLCGKPALGLELGENIFFGLLHGVWNMGTSVRRRSCFNLYAPVCCVAAAPEEQIWGFLHLKSLINKTSLIEWLSGSHSLVIARSGDDYENS